MPHRDCDALPDPDATTSRLAPALENKYRTGSVIRWRCTRRLRTRDKQPDRQDHAACGKAQYEYQCMNQFFQCHCYPSSGKMKRTRISSHYPVVYVAGVSAETSMRGSVAHRMSHPKRWLCNMRYHGNEPLAGLVAQAGGRNDLDVGVVLEDAPDKYCVITVRDFQQPGTIPCKTAYLPGVLPSRRHPACLCGGKTQPGPGRRLHPWPAGIGRIENGFQRAVYSPKFVDHRLCPVEIRLAPLQGPAHRRTVGHVAQVADLVSQLD